VNAETSAEGTSGLVCMASRRSFEDTMGRLESALASRGLTVFARIDFSGDAAKVGLKMNPSRLIIFGNPKAGTPLMVAAPTVAIDFPLKVLVLQDAEGQVWLWYNSVEYLRIRHRLPDELAKNLAGIGPIVKSVAE
jgi:uncharacterized protein (DUF302 family)